MINACRERGLPEPQFEEHAGGFRLIFRKDLYTPEQLRAAGLNDRQIQAVLYVKAAGSINNKEYQELTGASKPTSTRDLKDLVNLGILVMTGTTGRGTRYTLKGS